MRTPGTRTFTHRRKKAKNCAARNEKFLPVVIGYVIAIGIGLALPPLAVALYFGLAVSLD